MVVSLDRESKIAKVKAPEDQLSLAIGKEGQNVRLAAKLTGVRIEVEPLENVRVSVSSLQKTVKKEKKSASSVQKTKVIKDKKKKVAGKKK